MNACHKTKSPLETFSSGCMMSTSTSFPAFVPRNLQAMDCPYCKSPTSNVVVSRDVGGECVRERTCQSCGESYTTREILADRPQHVVTCPVCQATLPATELLSDGSMTIQCDCCQAKVRYRIATNGRIFATVDHESIGRSSS